MSGHGLVSVRLPQSMLHKLHVTAGRRGLRTNELAQIIVNGLEGLSGSQIREIPEPSLEATNPRLSVYLGQKGLQVLNTAATSSSLSPSSALRRALNAALTTKSFSPVQPLAKQKEESLSWLSILIAVVAAIVVPVLGAIVQSKTASVQQRGAP